MKRLLLALTLSSALQLEAAPLADCYFNLGTVTNTPQINAPCFVNEGLFDVFTSYLYDYQNVRSVTNRGTMDAVPGFRFDYVNDAGVRRPLDNFLNTGTIFADSAGFVIIGGGGIGGTGVGSFIGGFFNAAVMISADHLVNRGELRTSDGGLIRINGNRVDLTRSSIGVLPIQPGRAFETTTNFLAEAGLTDIYWGLTVDGTPQMVPGSVVTLAGRNLNVTSPNHTVTNAASRFPSQRRLSLANPAAYIYTNKLSETNWLVQGAFVGVSDTNISISVKFAPSPIPTNDYKTIVVRLASQETNVLNGGNFLTEFFILDRLVSDTNYVILSNLQTRVNSRPSTYSIWRNTPFEYATGIDSNAVISADLFYNTTQSNRVVTNSYAAYGLGASSSTAVLPPVPEASLTNSPGRVELIADELILDRTRIRGQSIVTVKTDNLISSSNAVLDVQNLHLTLASPDGELLVKSLAKPFVERTQGNIYLWSGSWSNQTGTVVTNVGPDPMDPTLMVTNMVTNVIDIGYHILMVDSSALTTHQPVFVDTFSAKSDHVIISDVINVTSNILVQADTLSIDGQLVLGDNIHDWTDLNFPGLNVLSNRGNIFVVGTGSYGCDRGTPYARIINTGTNTAYAHYICADVFENTGRIETAQIFTGGLTPIVLPNVGSISLNARSAKLEGGAFVAGGDIHLAGTDIKIRDYLNQAGKSLTLAVTNTLEDSGGDADNSFTVHDGFQLLVKPAVGDLLGSRFRTTAPRFQEVRHLWAGEDRGATKAGFSNNAAIGRLTVEGDLDTLHTFSGTGSANGLYVDFLELTTSVQQNLSDSILINPNLVIYYADANVPVEELDGQLDGHLRWVKEFAGPNSSVDVALSSGRTVKVNRGLRQSRIIDSDADGVANAFDLDPFGGIRIAKIEVTRAAPNTTLISFEAAANTTYYLESTPSLFAPNWQVLSTFVNNSETNRIVTLTDTVPTGARERYYRVRYNLP